MTWLADRRLVGPRSVGPRERFVCNREDVVLLEKVVRRKFLPNGCFHGSGCFERFGPHWVI